MVVAKIGEERELVCDRVREGEWAPWCRRAWDGSCEAVSRGIIVVIVVVDGVSCFFDSCSLS